MRSDIDYGSVTMRYGASGPGGGATYTALLLPLCGGFLVKTSHPRRYLDPLLSVCAKANKRAVIPRVRAGKSNVVDLVVKVLTRFRAMPLLRSAHCMSKMPKTKPCSDSTLVNRQPHMGLAHAVRSVEYKSFPVVVNAGEKGKSVSQ